MHIRGFGCAISLAFNTLKLHRLLLKAGVGVQKCTFSRPNRMLRRSVRGESDFPTSYFQKAFPQGFRRVLFWHAKCMVGSKGKTWLRTDED